DIAPTDRWQGCELRVAHGGGVAGGFAMAKAKSYLPQGTRTITPHLVVKGGSQAIEFYKKAFGATLNNSFPGPGGMIMHAELKIGDSVFFLTDEFLETGAKGPLAIGGSPVTIQLYVQD